MYYNEWGINKNVFKKAFDIVYSHFVKMLCLILKKCLKKCMQITSKVKVQKPPCTGLLTSMQIKEQIALSAFDG